MAGCLAVKALGTLTLPMILRIRSRTSAMSSGNEGGSATALVGSHNMTGFALRKLKGEAGVLLERAASDLALPTFVSTSRRASRKQCRMILH
jgi:hypothetical protein